MTPILKALTALAAPAGPRSKLSVFYFHRVLAEPDPLLAEEPDAQMFDRLLGWIGSQYRVLDPVEACDRLYAGTLPSRPAVITFDDGYRDNYSVALPLLQKHRMQAAFFVSTAFLDGGMMFNDRVIEAVRNYAGDEIRVPEGNEVLPLRGIDQRRQAIDRILALIKHLPPRERLIRVDKLERVAGGNPRTDVMMSPGEVAALHRAGMRIGGHTRTHPILLALDDKSAKLEIEGGLDDLASITGERSAIFAYPNGRFGSDFDSRHVAMLKSTGIRYGFTTHSGVSSAQSPRLMLPRFTPWDRTRIRFLLRSLLNFRSTVGAGPA